MVYKCGAVPGFYLLSWIALSSPMRILHLVEGFDWGVISRRDSFSWGVRVLDFLAKKEKDVNLWL